MKKYVVKRSNVYAGSLMKSIDAKCVITDQNGREVSEEELRKEGVPVVSFSCGVICRGMMFSIKDNVSEDLIYTTPSSYAIDTLTTSIVTPSGFKIEDWCSMEPILKYLGYGEELTQRELNQVYKKLICRRNWLEKHIELFGWKKTKLGYTSGGKQVLPMNLYNKLSSISCGRNGEPYKEEPGFALIKRKRTKE